MRTDLVFDRVSATSPVPVPDSVGFRELLVGAGRDASPARGHLDDAEAIVVFDFGTGDGLEPCRSNLQLARVVQSLPDLPVLAQREVATALARAGRLVVDLECTVMAPTRPRYVATSHVARAAAGLVTAAGWRTVAVLAHPGHVARCVATLEAAGLTVVTPPISRTQVDFDPASGQWWTRRRVPWVLRELGVVLAHRLTATLRPAPA